MSQSDDLPARARNPKHTPRPCFFIAAAVKNRAGCIHRNGGLQMTKQHYLLNEVARLVGVKGHKIHYALANGYLAEPAERINDKRIFTERDVAQITAYFADKAKRGGRNATTTP